MKIQSLNLHGLNVEEALAKTARNLDYCISHDIDMLDINHGKGYHSQRSFSVVKKEIRKMLKEYPALRDAGYRVVYGESDLPIALSFDDGHTLIVKRSQEKNYIGGRVQQEKNQVIYSDEGKKMRKQAKQMRHAKGTRNRKYF